MIFKFHIPIIFWPGNVNFVFYHRKAWFKVIRNYVLAFEEILGVLSSIAPLEILKKMKVE